MAAVKFGTSGLRGPADDLDDPLCAACVRAFLACLRDRGAPARELMVGRDRRPSSPRIAAACLGAAGAAGVTALDCGIVPTPALALEAARKGAAAIMVTGSHIPFERNGLKFFRPGGDEISKADEAAIVARLEAPGAAGAGAVPPPPDIGAGVRARYADRYVGFFGPAPLRGRRIGVHEHSSSAREVMVEILGRLGATVVPLGRTDRFVPIDTEAIDPDAAARLAAWVRAHRLDAIVSTDGDGDRPLIADEEGTVLRGDLVGALTARILKADAVATPLTSSTAIERSGWFATVRRTRIGSPFVIEAIAALRAEGARLAVGYEANGGFILGGAAASHGRTLAALPTRDAMLPIVALLAAAAAAGTTLSALAAGLPRRATASGRLAAIPDAVSAPLLATLGTDPVARLGLLEGFGRSPVAVDTLDGVRMTLASGEIAHLRASGNAPELRVYAEADSPERATRLVGDLLARVATLLGHPA
jgi:phosphomannomutase